MTANVNFIDLPSNYKEEELLNAVETAFKTANFSEDYELSIKFIDDEEIQSLNKMYRSKDKPTNVLSFPNDDDLYLGDIAISIQTIINEAKAEDKTTKNHLIHIIIHGCLHLLGFDHQTDKQAEEMESIEIEALSTLGIKNPYI